jgi:hypothetical protein
MVQPAINVSSISSVNVLVNQEKKQNTRTTTETDSYVIFEQYSFVSILDDMNMPEMDKYYTVQAHTILRQYLDYKHWYDRQKLTLRDIHNCQYVACMNPTAGNFTIDSRIQRHFAVFAVSFPGQVNHRLSNIMNDERIVDVVLV